MTPGHGLGNLFLRYPARATRLMLSEIQPEVITTVNLKLALPTNLIPYYDQGQEGACVGYGYSWMMSILNKRRYDANWLYRRAQIADGISITPPEEGTTSQAGADVLMIQGHRRILFNMEFLPNLSEGISNVRWAKNIDELRICISRGIPFGSGIPWFTAFDAPEWDKEMGWVIGRDLSKLGQVRGGHFICSFGARDLFDSFDLVNSWGYDYPLVKMPYKTMEYLMQQGSEHAIITDR